MGLISADRGLHIQIPGPFTPLPFIANRKKKGGVTRHQLEQGNKTSTLIERREGKSLGTSQSQSLALLYNRQPRFTLCPYLVPWWDNDVTMLSLRCSRMAGWFEERHGKGNAQTAALFFLPDKYRKNIMSLMIVNLIFMIVKTIWVPVTVIRNNSNMETELCNNRKLMIIILSKILKLS